MHASNSASDVGHYYLSQNVGDLNNEHHNFTWLTFTASWRIWLIVFGPLSMKALRGTQLFSRSSTVSCSRKRILAGNSLLFIKDRIRPKYWSIKDWRKDGEKREGVRTGRACTHSIAAGFTLALAVSQVGHWVRPFPARWWAEPGP